MGYGVSYFPVAVQRYHDQGNSQSLIWCMFTASESLSMIIMAGSAVAGKQTGMGWSSS